MSSAPHLEGLGEIKLATPCSVPWDSMKGDARVRFCDQCGQNVYDVQNLTAAEVKEVLAKNDGKVCGMLFFRADGKLITKDCPTGLAAIAEKFGDEKKRARLHFKSGPMVTAAAIGAMAVACLVYFNDGVRRALGLPAKEDPRLVGPPLADPKPQYPAQTTDGTQPGRFPPKYMGSFGQNNTY